MSELRPISKYDFMNGGEFDINVNYIPGSFLGGAQAEQYRGELRIRKDGTEYHLYVHYFQLRGPSGGELDEILLRSRKLNEVCDRATAMNEVIMRRMWPDTSADEIPEFSAVPDDVADDVYRKNNSSLAVHDYWRHHGGH